MPGLLQADDVLPWLSLWAAAGKRCALLTVVGIDGRSPRFVGAQMVVREDGEYAGYLSGGCLEESLVKEAQAAISRQQNRLVRYGKGSQYFDIRLPCGSGFEIYVDQSIDVGTIRQALALLEAGSIVELRTDLGTGRSRLNSITPSTPPPASRRDEQTFSRVYLPPLTLHLFGVGPAMPAIATLAAGVGFRVACASPHEGTQRALMRAGLNAEPMSKAAVPPACRPDRWSAAVVAFHDHEWEPPILKELLATPCFYFGALGSSAVHSERRRILASQGVTEGSLQRIRSPIGLISGAKSTATLAAGVIAEILQQAKAQALVM